ncbi:MAG: hypothetical protein ACLQBB_01390, partial [Solirubrobacteraceae bacterium]
DPDEEREEDQDRPEHFEKRISGGDQGMSPLGGLRLRWHFKHAAYEMTRRARFEAAHRQAGGQASLSISSAEPVCTAVDQWTRHGGR